MGLLTDWYWVASRRPDHRERKEGTSALGVVIVEAAGPYQAMAKAAELGLPDGERKLWLVPAPPEKYRNRFLRPAEAKELNLVMKEVVS